MKTWPHALLAAALSLLAVACGSAPPPPPMAKGESAALATPDDGGPRQVASVLELMDQFIDPAADVLWESVATISDRHGTVEHRPRTEADWLALRRSALVLVEATNLLAQPGRKLAQPGHVLADATASGMLTAAQIETALREQHGSLAVLARGLQDAGLEALAAIDARDVAKLEDSGGHIDEACEACHLVFWYPPAAKP